MSTRYQRWHKMRVSVKGLHLNDPVLYSKDPKPLATPALYCACLREERDNLGQSRLALAGIISIVTLRKRVADTVKLFPEIQN